MFYRTADAARPADYTTAITPSDVTRYPAARSVYVGGAGTVVVVHPDGTTFSYAGLTAGTVLSVQNIGVMATGTTATLLGAMY